MRQVTRDLVESINHKLLKLQDVSSWSEISMEGMLSAAAAGLESHEEATRLLALSWISFLLHINQEEVLRPPEMVVAASQHNLPNITVCSAGPCASG